MTTELGARKIYKYLLNDHNLPQKVEMPRGSKVVAVQNRRCKIMMWVEVDVNEPEIPYRFVVYSTGRPMYDFKQTYLGTVQISPDVWHVYQVQDSDPKVSTSRKIEP